MPEYTQLRINKISDTQISSIIAYSLVMFFDWGFVDAGAFNSVSIGGTDIRGSDRSRLKLVHDPNYTNGQVWQTFHNNLVAESGTSVGSPIQISGLFIGSTFHSALSGTYTIDYPNGRVIFNSAIPTGSIVKMAYSYKNVTIINSQDVPFLRDLQGNWNDLTDRQYNQSKSGEWSVNGERRLQLPVIAFETSVLVDRSPYELGSFKNLIDDTTKVHVIAESDTEAKNLSDIIADQFPRTLFLLDIDRIAKSGEYPIGPDGSKNTNFKTYPQLVGTDQNTMYRLKRIYIKDSQVTASQWLGPECYYRVTRLKSEIVH